ncbi:DUF397 domain-containing protein [Nocardiopsis sediminis]|uniref:DUF397 domain-containing protein n=1 Tax=Nocardiopsis sediminis TaxID=1778267 RepID=A0ABV8FR27_9ACTN
MIDKAWHTSSYSGSSGSCVEVSEGCVTLVRDSQNQERGALAFPAREWWALIADIRELS